MHMTRVLVPVLGLQHAWHLLLTYISCAQMVFGAVDSNGRCGYCELSGGQR
jgi:hypothetical protein